jgi:hypothetical protein
MSKTVTVSTIVAVKDFLDNLKNEVLELVDSGEVENTLNSVQMTITKANSTVARTLSKSILETIFADQEVLDLVDSKMNALLEDTNYLSEALAEVCEAYELEDETDPEDSDADEDSDEDFEDEDELEDEEAEMADADAITA